MEAPIRARVLVQPATPLPARSRVDVSGSSQVSRRSILYLCPGPGSRPNRRPSPLRVGVVDAAPAPVEAKASACRDIGTTAGLQYLLSTLQEWCCHHHMQDSLPAGWLAFTGRESNPLDRCERFPSCYISFSLPGFILTLQGSSLRIGLCCLDPSSLARPHPPRSRAHCNFTARRLICDA